jgi:tetratricopeptide (TPR) repeat protein
VRQGLAIAYANTASALSRTGDVKQSLEYLNKGLEIMRSLVSASPQNRGQKSILAAMLAVRGTVLLKAKQPQPAIQDLEDARSTYELLAGPDDLHTDSAACDVKLGQASAAAFRTDAASSYFQRALRIAEPLIAMGDPDLDALYSAADAYSGMGDLSLKEAQRHAVPQSSRDLEQAQSWYKKSLAAWNRIPQRNRFTPNGFEAGDPNSVSRNLARAEAEFKKRR